MTLDSWQAREVAPGWRHRGEPVGSLLEKWSADWTLADSAMKRFSKSKESVRLYKLLSDRWIFGFLVLYFFQNLTMLSLVLSPQVFLSFYVKFGPQPLVSSPNLLFCCHNAQSKNCSNSWRTHLYWNERYYILQVCFEVCCAGFLNKLFTGNVFANHETCIVELPPLPFKVYEPDGCTPLWWMKTVISKM